MSVSFEPYSTEHKVDPFPAYRELRDHAPVHHAKQSDTWVLSRYDDVQWAFRETKVFSSKMDRQRRGGARGEMSLFQSLRMFGKFLRHMRTSPRRVMNARMLINEDAEVHTAMRNIVNRGFRPRQIAAWEPRIREIVAGCMADVRSRECFDLVQDLAVPLPVTVIAEILGVDPADRHDFKRWSNSIIQGGTGTGIANMADSGLIEAMGEMSRYFRPLLRARRKEPQDDLLSVLVASQKDDGGLDDYEIFMFVLLLLIAGNETTTNLLGNATDVFLDHPEQLALVRDDPTLVPAAIEEILRYDGVVQFLTRQVVKDVERHGVVLPKGSVAVLLVGSANRDERRFPEPDRFDVTRDTRGHLGFGHGAHFCLGSSLARLEARVALEALVPELSGRVRATPDREFLDSYLIRGRSRLELRRAA